LGLSSAPPEKDTVEFQTEHDILPQACTTEYICLADTVLDSVDMFCGATRSDRNPQWSQGCYPTNIVIFRKIPKKIIIAILAVRKVVTNNRTLSLSDGREFRDDKPCLLAVSREPALKCPFFDYFLASWYRR